MKKKRDLILFTASFPYGIGETFLEVEITYLSKKFDKVYIIPQQVSFNENRTLPSNCFVIIEHLKAKNKPVISLRHYFSSFPVLFNDLKLSSFNRRKIIYKYSHLKSLLARSIILKQWYTRQEFKSPVHYTYWFNDSATILNFMSVLGLNISFISRAHGFDLFEERNENSHIPYRKFQFKSLKKVFSVSKTGMKYLQKKYPNQSSKIDVSYLGSQDYGFNDDLSFGNKFLIVSCSSIIPLKRIHLIVELLSELNLPVKWVHFGDGPLREEILNELNSLSRPIEFELKGFVSNKELCSFYASNHIDLFINVSETEGLPYSIMEAMSFGIPTIATDVGGVSEIVNKDNGVLIEKDFNPNDVSKIISDFLQSNSRNWEFRKGIRLQWEQKFSAQNNYSKFIEKLLKA